MSAAASANTRGTQNVTDPSLLKKPSTTETSYCRMLSTMGFRRRSAQQCDQNRASRPPAPDLDAAFDFHSRRAGRRPNLRAFGQGRREQRQRLARRARTSTPRSGTTATPARSPGQGRRLRARRQRAVYRWRFLHSCASDSARLTCSGVIPIAYVVRRFAAVGFETMNPVSRHRSSRAAGKLLHVFRKGLGAKLQTFDHREIREELIGKLTHGHSRAQRERRALNELASLGRDRLNAD